MKRFICSLIALVCVFSFICFTGSGSTAKADKVELPSLPAINAAEQLYQSLLQATQSRNIDNPYTITGASYPQPGSTLKKGQKFELKGLIKADVPILVVDGVVYNTNTGYVELDPVQIYPKKKQVEIYPTRINTGLKFGKLPAGNFTLLICVHTEKYGYRQLIKTSFKVR